MSHPRWSSVHRLKKKQRQEAVKRCRKRKSEEIANLKTTIDQLKSENALLSKKMKAILEKAMAGETKSVQELSEEVQTAKEIADKRCKILRDLWEAINCGGVQELKDMAPDLYHKDYTMIK